MGVDYSSQLGYGFKLSPETVEHLKELDVEGVGIWDYLENMLPHTLELVEAGSMYDSKPNEYIISVRRLTRSIDQDEGAAYIRLDTPVLTQKQAADLWELYDELEANNGTPVGAFYAGLWR